MKISIKRFLTKREIEICELIAQGLTNRQIAQRIYVSYSTVKNHVGSIFHKLDITTRAQVGQALIQGVEKQDTTAVIELSTRLETALNNLETALDMAREQNDFLASDTNHEKRCKQNRRMIEFLEEYLQAERRLFSEGDQS